MKDNEYSFESRAINLFLIVSELASNNNIISGLMVSKTSNGTRSMFPLLSINKNDHQEDKDSYNNQYLQLILHTNIFSK